MINPPGLSNSDVYSDHLPLKPRRSFSESTSPVDEIDESTPNASSYHPYRDSGGELDSPQDIVLDRPGGSMARARSRRSSRAQSSSHATSPLLGHSRHGEGETVQIEVADSGWNDEDPPDNSPLVDPLIEAISIQFRCPLCFCIDLTLLCGHNYAETYSCALTLH